MAAEAEREARLIVCAVDGSIADTNAVEVATQLAVLAKARLALVAVAPVRAGDARHGFGQRAWTLEEALSALELTAKTLDSRIPVDCYVDAGNPVHRLAEFAALTQALLLVVGTNATTGRPPSIVASGLVRSAPCPVVVVPQAGPVPALDTPGVNE